MLKTPIKRWLARRGFELRRVPPALARDPGAQLAPSLELVVAHHLRRGPPVRFVQVGAYDGVMADGLHKLVAEHGWRGVVVEPQPEAVPAWVHGMASFDRQLLLRHKRFIPGIERMIESVPVQCVTLATLLERAGLERVDLLQVDAEGYDAEIVRQVDFQRIAPAIIRYEHKHLSAADQNDCAKRLIEQGYRLALDRQDTIAYRR